MAVITYMSQMEKVINLWHVFKKRVMEKRDILKKHKVFLFANTLSFFEMEHCAYVEIDILFILLGIEKNIIYCI